MWTVAQTWSSVMKQNTLTYDLAFLKSTQCRLLKAACFKKVQKLPMSQRIICLGNPFSLGGRVGRTLQLFNLQHEWKQETLIL